MTDRLLVDVDTGGRVSVSVWRDGELPDRVGEPVELVWPLDVEALEDLRWYLEDYLRAPFGVYEERGPWVAERLPEWGEAVFGAVFGSGPARDAYVRLRAGAVRDPEVVFRSTEPGWLGLPWELLRDPDRPTPLALDGVGVSRSLPAARLGKAFTVGGDQLRVLMVISRPAGSADVGYRMIARPLVERLEAVRGRVDLVVLRPPTLQRLEAELAAAREAGTPFQVVHFDGHGVLTGSRSRPGAGAPLRFDGKSHGVLVFEKPGGGADEVPAEDVARVLAVAQVPLVVLNACQSGAVGKQVEAAVATRLLAEGAASVVAMAYSVYAVAAAEFMTAFYERLFAGDRVSEAVSAGRARLARANRRPSPKGMMPLADWVVPVHYLRRDMRFPGLRDLRPAGAPSLDEMLDRLRDTNPVDAREPLAAVDRFVGRDGLFYEVEAAARLQRVVLLHGPGGTGKTELAKAFGRWWQDTAGVDRPEWVIWHSFEPGVASFGLDGALTVVGLRVFGPDFAQLAQAERREAVHELMVGRRLLLIWDNFETVHSMPDPSGATPPLGEDERAELAEFLARVAARGAGAVLLTSRSPEPWLDPVRRIEVGGLASHEATEYAEELLAPYPNARPRRATAAFGELLAWLDGHPLSMRLILPHLNTTDPAALLAALRGTVPLPGPDITGDRTSSLAASIAYSFDHLPTDSARLLAALSLVQGVADADVLALFSQHPDVPARFRGATATDWTRALDAAAAVGLLSPLGEDMYRLHPILPAYLAGRWQSETDQYGIAVAAADTAMLDAHAALSDWLADQIDTGDAGLAFSLIELQQRTLGRLLGHALDHQLWTQAAAIADPLDRYLEARGMAEEARGWVDRTRLATEAPDGTPPPLDSPAGALWVLLVGAQANRQAMAHQLDQAAHTYQQILAMLRAQPDLPYTKPSLAVTYHQLGMVAQRRGRLDQAEDWYRRSLSIREELGDRLGIAGSYHQLGMVAQRRGRLDQAEDWYRRSLSIKEELGARLGMAATYGQLSVVAVYRGRLDEAEDWRRRSLAVMEEVGDRSGMARCYHELGIVAHERGRPDEAEDWYRRSLAVMEEVGDRSGMARVYHELGMVAQRRGRLEQAEDWYRQSLTLFEELGDRLGIASSYHQLGRVAELRGWLEQAEDWYRQSLAIKEELGDRPGMAGSYGQLGLLAEQRGQPAEALAWTIRCVALFDEFPHPATGPGPEDLARLTGLLGHDVLERTWRTVSGSPLPRAVAEYIEARIPRRTGRRFRLRRTDR